MRKLLNSRAVKSPWARAGLALIILNEIRGAVFVGSFLLTMF